MLIKANLIRITTLFSLLANPFNSTPLVYVIFVLISSTERAAGIIEKRVPRMKNTYEPFKIMCSSYHTLIISFI